MGLWQDGAIAALAAVGLTTLVWLTATALLHPRERYADAAALVCGREDAAGLEQTVRALERIRYDSRGFSRIVIVDCGMSGEAREVAQALCRGGYGVELCAKEDLPEVI